MPASTIPSRGIWASADPPPTSCGGATTTSRHHLVGLMEEHAPIRITTGLRPSRPAADFLGPDPGAAGDRRVARPPFNLHERLAPPCVGGYCGSWSADFSRRSSISSHSGSVPAGPGDLPHGARAARRRAIPGDSVRRPGAQPRTGREARMRTVLVGQSSSSPSAIIASGRSRTCQRSPKASRLNNAQHALAARTRRRVPSPGPSLAFGK